MMGDLKTAEGPGIIPRFSREMFEEISNDKAVQPFEYNYTNNIYFNV